MEKEDENYSEAGEPGQGVMVDYVIPPHHHHHHHHHHQQQQHLFVEPTEGSMNIGSSAVDRALSFADVMQFADFGPKLGLHHSQQDGDPNSGIDPINFLKFPVLNNQIIMSSGNNINTNDDNCEGIGQFMYDQQGNSNANLYSNPVQLEFMGNAAGNNSNEENNNIVENNTAGDEKIIGGGGGLEGGGAAAGKTTKRKRPRTVKTTEEVESQRMTHIAVERNRRKQMNEHLRVLRSLMPSSYVQRGDQASIIGGAIEFVRELEQLLQCLESQKRRRLYGDQAGPSPSTLSLVQQPPQPVLGFPPPTLEANPGGGPLVSTHYQDDQLRLVELDPTNCNAGLLWEESAESKSTIADVEVKMSGFNALIKILSRRRPGQLIKIIADLEDLQFSILHTNITTIEQTVLYSFNVQVSSEARFTAEDIASSVQQSFTFIHANTNII